MYFFRALFVTLVDFNTFERLMSSIIIKYIIYYLVYINHEHIGWSACVAVVVNAVQINQTYEHFGNHWKVFQVMFTHGEKSQIALAGPLAYGSCNFENFQNITRADYLFGRL